MLSQKLNRALHQPPTSGRENPSHSITILFPEHTEHYPRVQLWFRRLCATILEMRPTCHVYKKSGFPHSSQRPAHSSKGFILDGRCENTTMPSSTHVGSSLPDLLVSTSQLIALSSNSAKTIWIIDTFGSFHLSFLDASLQLSWTLLPDVLVTQSCVFTHPCSSFSLTATLCSLKEIHPYSCLCSWGLCRLLTNCMESVFLKCQLVCHGITLMPSGHPLGLVPTERPFCAGDTSGPFKQRILCACVCLCMYVCECEHVHVSVHVCMCVYVYMWACSCMYVCVFMHVWVFIWACLYIMRVHMEARSQPWV